MRIQRFDKIMLFLFARRIVRNGIRQFQRCLQIGIRIHTAQLRDQDIPPAHPHIVQSTEGISGREKSLHGFAFDDLVIHRFPWEILHRHIDPSEILRRLKQDRRILRHIDMVGYRNDPQYLFFDLRLFVGQFDPVTRMDIPGLRKHPSEPQAVRIRIVRDPLDQKKAVDRDLLLPDINKIPFHRNRECFFSPVRIGYFPGHRERQVTHGIRHTFDCTDLLHILLGKAGTGKPQIRHILLFVQQIRRDFHPVSVRLYTYIYRHSHTDHGKDG